MVYKFFDKKTLVCAIKSEITFSQLLAKEVHKPIIRNFEKWKKMYSSSKNNIFGDDLRDMQLLSKKKIMILNY